MKKIESFQVDHRKLLPGLYVSRVDSFGSQALTTYDLRMKRPNTDRPLTTAAVHTIEHLGATFLRLRTDAPVVYFGPMGCRTGFYLVLAGDPDLLWTLALVEEMMESILDAETVPGASGAECGNAADHDLAGAKEEAEAYLEALSQVKDKNDSCLHYPKKESEDSFFRV